MSFRREAHVAKGGPDGGDGGKGGDVWLVASAARPTLLPFRDHPHRRGGDGRHGQGKNRHGPCGADLVVDVPVGTVVKDRSGAVLADLGAAGMRWLAAEGGRGGRGNARFLSNRRRAPSFAEQGEEGEERWLELELRLVADVALVGFPNVGKSTFISRVSAAKPKIADYPFTTLEPNLGVVRLPGEGGELVVADVPGLVEGASEGRGLGHRFLRHVERARVLLVMLDSSPLALHPPGEQLEVLLRELGRYRSELLERPRVVVCSRSDLGEAVPAGECARPVSAVTGEGIWETVWNLASALDHGEVAAPSPAIVVHRAAGEGVEVRRGEDGAWEVTGREARRAVAVSDLNDPEAVEWAQSRLRRLGVDRALGRNGAKPGDLVRVGDLVFTWETS